MRKAKTKVSEKFMTLGHQWDLCGPELEKRLFPRHGFRTRCQFWHGGNGANGFARPLFISCSLTGEASKLQLVPLDFDGHSNGRMA